MPESNNKIVYPCQTCLHKTVCALIEKIEQIYVSIPDVHFKAIIDCSECIPLLDMDTSNEDETEEQA